MTVSELIERLKYYRGEMIVSLELNHKEYSIKYYDPDISVDADMESSDHVILSNVRKK